MKYNCAHCGKDFEGTWSDEEANAEAKQYSAWILPVKEMISWWFAMIVFS